MNEHIPASFNKIKSSNDINPDFVRWLGLEPQKIIFSLCQRTDKLSKQGFVIEKKQESISVRSPSATGLVAGISEFSASGCIDDTPHNPDLSYRSHHRWLPFDMGQRAYGQAGYDCFDNDTDNWWYDRIYWQQYLFELAKARYNAIHFWNVHPYPVLIRYKQHPYAAYFDQERVEKNIDQFKWIVETAKSVGIRIVLMQYNIHVSEGYAQKHDIAWVDDCGWGGMDNSEIRHYTRACLEELFELYPDLGGLMTAGELNKDAFEFYDEAIMPVIKGAGKHCNLHFRLWGQQDPEGIKRLVNNIEGKIHLWHKISHEQIWVPKVDYRIGKWHDLTGVPVNAICGPGMAAGLNYVEGVHYDPTFWQAQLSHLKQIGGNGIGYFSGDDNYLRFPGDYQKQKQAIDARRLASCGSWMTVGNLAWKNKPIECKNGSNRPLHTFLQLKDGKNEIDDVAGKVDHLFTELCQYHGMYNGQELGFATLLGARTITTEKLEEGIYPFCGCCAWPNDGFGITNIKEVRQLAIDFAENGSNEVLSRFKTFRDLISKINEIIKDNDLEKPISGYSNENDLRAGAFLYSKWATAYIGLIKYYAIRSAISAYGAPFCHNPVEWLEQSLVFIDQCLAVCTELQAILTRGWNVKMTYAVHARHSAYHFSDAYYTQLKTEKQQLEQILSELRKSSQQVERYRKFGRSVHWYFEVSVCLPTGGGYHHSEAAIEKAGDCIEKALSELDGLDEMAASWRTYLQQEKNRLVRPTMRMNQNSDETRFALQWDGFGYESSEPYTAFMGRILTSGETNQGHHLISSPKQVILKTSEHGLEVHFPPLFDPDAKYEEVDETLAPHQKISPAIYRDNDHYQISLAWPDDENVFNLKIIPKDKIFLCRTARLNAPHGLLVGDACHDQVRVTFHQNTTAVTLPWNLLRATNTKDLNLKFNVCQSRDFWEFVVASWSPMQSVQTFLDKDQLGSIKMT